MPKNSIHAQSDTAGRGWPLPRETRVSPAPTRTHTATAARTSPPADAPRDPTCTAAKRKAPAVPGPFELLRTVGFQAVAALGEAAVARTLSKQELQYTGRSVLGENGTTAWPPHSAQIAA